MGDWSDEWVKKYGRIVESFEIAADEQLIGAELYYSENYFEGVTFLKCKIFKWRRNLKNYILFKIYFNFS